CGATHSRNGGDLRIGVVDRLTSPFTVRGYFGKSSRGFTFKPKNATGKVFREHAFRGSQQSFLALATGEQFDAIEYFGVRNGRGKEFRGGAPRDPSQHPRRRPGSHEFGKYVGVKDYHSSNFGAGRIASRCGNGSSTPPSAANLC